MNEPSANKTSPHKVEAGVKLRGAEKLARIPVKVERTQDLPRKPDWIRVKMPSDSHRIGEIKQALRDNNLHTVCEEASCPNLPECFSSGTATFMILGDICTRRCPFCDVGHGRPLAPDDNEPEHLAKTIKAMKLRYVVITSVDRDDLRDGGAGHFARCIAAVRRENPEIKIEVLVPDFRGRLELALSVLSEALPDVFNHNLETVPRLYKEARPGSDYQHSLNLLQEFKRRYPHIPTKSGLMLGLGETNEELERVMLDMRKHSIDRITLGQYLQPSRDHLPVKRFVPPAEFNELGQTAKSLGFEHVTSGPMVRSSYHADKQDAGEELN